MTLNLDRILSEVDVSLEDLPIESLVQTDLDGCESVFNKLFQDHITEFTEQNDNSFFANDDFDVDVESIEFDDVLQDNNDMQLVGLNLSDILEEKKFNENDHSIFLCASENSPVKKISHNMRRQSTRIQNQMRKKIAEQIQRENIRLAKEAQLLQGNFLLTLKQSKKKSYLSVPTDLDADDDDEKTDDDPNKLWCICRQPYGNRFMICCDSCSEWYHGDCVSVTQAEGAKMEENSEEFICPQCINNVSIADDNSNNKHTEVSEPEPESVVISDDDDDAELLEINDDDDCYIIKTTDIPKYHDNIFQLLSNQQPQLCSQSMYPVRRNCEVRTISARTSVCLQPGCKTLVNPRKSLYCSKRCIDKYTKMVIKNNRKEKVSHYGLEKGMRLAKMTRFVLAQIETETIQDEVAAPTEENLTEFLLKNPTYKVFQSSLKRRTGPVKTKKVVELVKADAAKRIKVVKHFALICKRVAKRGPLEFKNVWQLCVKLEDSVFRNSGETIVNGGEYMSRIKQLSEYFSRQLDNRLSLDFVQQKLSVSSLASMSKEDFDKRYASSGIDLLQQLNMSTINGSNSKKDGKSLSKTGGISSLLRDTTQLHGQHLYDINCKICNGGGGNASSTTKSMQQNERNGDNVQLTNCLTENTVTLPDNSCSQTSDEFKVSSSVETPDMSVDMDISSTPSDDGMNKPEEPCDQTNPSNVVADSSVTDGNLSSDQSTIKAKRKMTSLWEGDVSYKEIGTVQCKSYLISRLLLGGQPLEDNNKKITQNGDELRELIKLSSSINEKVTISGRIKMGVVQDYLTKLRKRSNKEFIVLRLHPSDLNEGRTTYHSLFQYFHSHDRCGVVSEKKIGLKDCYIYPLNAHVSIPQFFLPFVGPGLEKRRPHLLLLIIVRSPLDQLNYLPISPKYDQNHEIASKHGINLEKYCQVTSFVKSTPSPLNENVVNISTEAHSNVEEKKCDESTTAIPSDSVGVKEAIEETFVNEPSSNKKDEIETCKSKNPDKKPILNESANSTAKPLDTDAISGEPKEHPVPKTTANLHNKEPIPNKTVQTDPGVQNKLLKLQQILIDTILNGDKSLQPVSSLSTQKKEPEKPPTLEEIENQFSKDIDFRNLTCNSSIPLNELFAFEPANSTHQPPIQDFKRKYTFYDPFEHDNNSLIKRSKYFFNPIDPDNLFHCHNRNLIHQKPMNFSVYSPKSDVNKQNEFKKSSLM